MTGKNILSAIVALVPTMLFFPSWNVYTAADDSLQPFAQTPASWMIEKIIEK